MAGAGRTLQEQNSLTLAAVAQPEVGSVSQILGASHGASFFPSIDTLRGGGVGVEGDEGVG